jgi:formamidopyrimidine-DNA glycosylase
MPELPEVETMRRGIAGVVGCQIEGVLRPRCKLRPIEIAPDLARFRRRVVGRTITATDRVGKRVVLRLSDGASERGDVIVIEPRMTGLVLVADPPNREHLRLGFSLAGGKVPELWFWDRRGLGSVRLVSPEEFALRFGSDRLGPDALQISPEELAARLATSRREIKVALLDQRALAGVGNLYASELLHRSGIHPRRRCHRLGRDEWRRLHSAMREVLEEAIMYEGSTLSDGTYRNALNNAGSYQNKHRVYDRADEACGTCATKIVRIVQAQRSSFFCPRCQPLRQRRKTAYFASRRRAKM